MGISDIIRQNQNKEAMLKRSLDTLVELYSDRIHFIYELLQNAEDAGANIICFKQLEDRLEVMHDGFPFSQSNLQSICDAALSDKKNVEGMIGKFGLGFKSVFTICNTVYLYSEPSNKPKENAFEKFAIKIVNYIDSFDIDKEWNHENIYTTKFVFPYYVWDKFYTSKEELKKGIANKLKNLGTSVLLFLKNIKEIHYEIIDASIDFNSVGVYSLKRERLADNLFRITPNGNKNINDKTYFVFSKKIDNSDRIVDIAFPIMEENQIIKFIKTKMTYISVFFPTEIKSGLNFIVQAPYDLTPNRSSLIKNSPLNAILNNTLKELLKEAVFYLRDQNILSLEFLNLLPFIPAGGKDEWELYDMYSCVLQMLKTEAIIPSINNKEYVTAENAKIVRGKELAELFKDDLLEKLLRQPKARWLSPDFTENNLSLRQLHNFFKEELEIDEIRPGSLVSLLKENTDFLRNVNNNWLLGFYKYLSIKEKSLLGKNGDFATVPFIKTENGNFHAPYLIKKSNGIIESVQKIFIKPKSINFNIQDFYFIDSYIEKNCPELIEAFDLREPSGLDYFIKELKSSKNVKIDDAVYIRQIKEAIKYLLSEPDKTINIFKELLLLNVIDMLGYRKNITCFNNKIYRENDKNGVSLKEYFIGIKEEVYILNENFYLKNGITQNDFNILEELGIKNNVYNGLNQETWAEGRAECRAIENFRKNLTFDFIDEVLQYIIDNPFLINSKNKSKNIFLLVKNVESYLHGKYRFRTTNPEEKSGVSLIIEILKDTKKWLFYNNKLVKPWEISRYNLDSNIYGKVDDKSVIYDLLGFIKSDTEKQIDLKNDMLSRYSKDEIYNIVLDMIQEEKEEYKEKLYHSFFGRKTGDETDEQNIFDPNKDSSDNSFPQEYIKDIERLKDKIKISYLNALNVEYEAKLRKVRTSLNENMVKEHLRTRYRNFCQICQKEKKYWEITEILNKPKKELEQMNLSLCPNCATEYRIMRNNESKMNAFLYEIKNIDSLVETVIPLEDKSIRFTNTHLAEIQEILKLEYKLKDLADAELLESPPD